MAILWHPLLAQFLRHHLSDRIQIRDSIPLGQMPIEMDLLLEPIVPSESLSYPYNHLGQQTIGEFKGAGDTADWMSVAQIESYACLYQMQQKIEDRAEITLWVIASQFSESFSRYIEDLTSIGEGVQRGTLAQFPIYRIDLETLPITLATFPLLMVYKGKVEREKEIVQFFIDHYEELGELSFFIKLLHPQALEEVLKMLDLESLRGFDLDLPAILRLFDTEKIIQNIGMEKVIQTVGMEKVIQTIGIEKIIQTFGPEDLAKTIGSSLNDEEREKFIEQMRQWGEDGATGRGRE
ncbi:hypothetical protein HYR99_01190 [Candidatus Poribacteria bacterium]|nr:hypothetical protein [Candidatus Poribacteria bacterium]